MFRFLRYSSFNLVVGKAKDITFIKDREWPSGYTIICTPISLNIRLWAVGDIRAIVRSGKNEIDTVPYRTDGTIEDVNEFKLDWESPEKLIAIGYFDGANVIIGTPVWHKYLDRQDRYTIQLKIEHSGKLVNVVEYDLLHEDMYSLNDMGGV